MSRFRSLTLLPIRGWINTSFAACLGAALLLALSGCTSMKVHLGMKVYLAKTPVASIAVNLPNGPGIAPGESQRSWL